LDITIKIPDQVWNEDPSFVLYFQKVQAMVDRMAMSHFKYGPIDTNAVIGEVNETKSGLQRVSMYDPSFINQDEVWAGKTPKSVNTGNTENLLDAANFFVIEAMFPKHSKAHFKAQTTVQSPGLDYEVK